MEIEKSRLLGFKQKFLQVGLSYNFIAWVPVMGSQFHPLYLCCSQQLKYTLNGKTPFCPLQVAFGHSSREDHFGWGKFCDSQGSSSFSWVTHPMTRKQKGREEKEERMLLLLYVYVIVGLIQEFICLILLRCKSFKNQCLRNS